MPWTPEQAAEIWRLVNLGEPYAWSIRKAAVGKLLDMLGPQCPAGIDRDGYASAPGEALTFRASLARVVRNLEDEERRPLAFWIVRDWGGIHAVTDATLDDYLRRLRAFDDDSIWGVSDEFGIKGISSWSKLVAFARPDHFAIYDTRTSVALNCALLTLNDRRRFAMPRGRNVGINNAQDLLAAQARGVERLGYREYLCLLRAFVTLDAVHNPPRTLLEAEMVVFANAPRAARLFLQTGPEAYAPPGQGAAPSPDGHIIFPHANCHRMPIREFMDRWRVWDWAVDGVPLEVPRLNRPLSNDDLIEANCGHGLDALCRTCVPATRMNTMHATNVFMKRNSDYLESVEVINPLSRKRVNGARLKPSAAKFL